jgi:hypothetical protein
MKIYQLRPAVFASTRTVACFPAEIAGDFPEYGPRH